MNRKGPRHDKHDSGPEGDPDGLAPQVPSQRALDALADAVRRAREASGWAPPRLGPVTVHRSAPAGDTAAADQGGAGVGGAGRPGADALEEKATEVAASAPVGAGAGVERPEEATEPGEESSPDRGALPEPGSAAPPEDLPTQAIPVLPGFRAAQADAPRHAEPPFRQPEAPQPPPRAPGGVRQGGAPARRRRGGRRSPPLGLIGGLAVAATIVALMAVTVVAVTISRRSATTGGSGPGSTLHRTAGTGGAGTTSPPPASTQAPSGTAGSTSTTTSTTLAPTTTTPPPTSTAGASGAAPKLLSVTPGSAKAGSVVTVHGSNLSSPNGSVLARVAGQPAPTSCPSLTACRVTVPSLAGSGTEVPVTITTESGTSNAVLLRYG